MDEPQVRANEPHPFEQFKATMRKLVKVSKAQLDEQLKEHDRTKPERRAGQKRYACKNATFMFHGVGFDLINQTMRLEEKFLKERLDSILSDQRRIGTIIADRTKLDAAEIEGLFFEAQTKDATFAAGCGII